MEPKKQRRRDIFSQVSITNFNLRLQSYQKKHYINTVSLFYMLFSYVCMMVCTDYIIYTTTSASDEQNKKRLQPYIHNKITGTWCTSNISSCYIIPQYTWNNFIQCDELWSTGLWHQVVLWVVYHFQTM